MLQDASNEKCFHTAHYIHTPHIFHEPNFKHENGDQMLECNKNAGISTNGKKLILHANKYYIYNHFTYCNLQVTEVTFLRPVSRIKDLQK